MKETLPKFETIGQFLKHYRKAKNLSLGLLSNETEKYGEDGKWSKGYIGLVENDTPTKKGAVSRPSPEKLKSICEVLNAPYQEAMRLTYDIQSAITVGGEPVYDVEIEKSFLDFFRKLSRRNRYDVYHYIVGLYREQLEGDNDMNGVITTKSPVHREEDPEPAPQEETA